MIRRLIAARTEHIIRELTEIKIDENALVFFIGKSRCEILRFDRLSAAQANVLKQTALVCGADLAIPKNAYRGSAHKNFSAILFANRREIGKIVLRLDEQKWMTRIADELRIVLQPEPSLNLDVGTNRYSIDRTFIMGIINLTTDSFYSGSRYVSAEIVKKAAREMEREGADFIDIGAESTRPGAMPTDEKEEIMRLKTFLPAVVKSVKIPVSVDTYKSRIAEFAIDHGASMINDISGLGFDRANRSRTMARIVAHGKAGLVIMHIKGKPRTMQVQPEYNNLMAEIHAYFTERLQCATDAGINPSRIIIDPGLGFGKQLHHNYEIILRLKEFGVFRRPIMVGHSRKSFIGAPFNLAPEQRLEGTLGSTALLIQNGASILRVHDVQEIKRVAMLVDRMLAPGDAGQRDWELTRKSFIKASRLKSKKRRKGVVK
ncbi:MAG TPA: dihydropteroate synthase [bacterium]